MVDQIRIFISYSHNDRDLVLDEIKPRIDKIDGLHILIDEELTAGSEFSEEIKNYIAFSHIFMPIISRASLKSGWVHQEIGYGSALNIPVVPLLIDKNVPPGMIQRLHAVNWDLIQGHSNEKLQDLFRLAIRKGVDERYSYFVKIRDLLDRGPLFNQYGEQVLRMGFHGMIRHRGALSGFAIPKKTISSVAWKFLYGENTNRKRIENAIHERKMWDSHALKKGFKLILKPDVTYDEYCKKAGSKAPLINRLDSLIKFLKYFKEHSDKTGIVCLDPDIPFKEHLTIVGDFFFAHTLSASQGEGLENTLFTRHALTVKAMAESFDEEILEKLESQNILPEKSLDVAIEELSIKKKKIEHE